MIAPALAAALILNPMVTPATIGSTICVRSWTASIRPPASYVRALKRRQLPAGARLSDYEEDHRVPLSLGGAARDPRNLRPQPWTEARVKDVEERALHRAVCAHRITLRAAQVKMLADWP